MALKVSRRVFYSNLQVRSPPAELLDVLKTVCDPGSGGNSTTDGGESSQDACRRHFLSN